MITGTDRRAAAAIGVGSAAVAAVVTFRHIGRPAVWTDEAATANAVRRSWGGLAHLLLGRDAPLVPYYVIAKIWYAVIGVVHTGDPWTVCRWLSALLACGCVGVLAGWIARRHRTTGLVAAGVLLALPGFERYAQEARPYSAMMLVATWSWIECHRSAAGDRGRRYAASIVVLALVNPFALVQVVAQVLATVARRSPDLRATWRALGTGLLVALPWAAWAAAHGRGPTAAHRHLTWDQVRTSATQAVAGPLTTTTWPIMLLVIASEAVVVGLVVAGRRELAVPALLWTLASPVLLPLAGAAVPVALVPRYWLSSLPGVALLVALAVETVTAAVGRAGAVVRVGVPALAVVGLVLLGVDGQRSIRRADGHSEDSHGAIAAASAPALRDLPILFTRGGDALVIAEARRAMQQRIVGWDRSRGTNVSEAAWSAQRTRTALASHDRVLLLVRDAGTFRRVRSEASLQGVVASRLRELHAHGVDVTDANVVFRGGAWIVAECTLA